MTQDNNNPPAGGWESNTHPTAYYNKSVCIDYLKFRFDIDYSQDSSAFSNLFYKLLHINYDEIDIININKGYTHLAHLCVGTDMLYGSGKTNNKDGQKTCLLEMKGKGCREFEDKYFSSHEDFNKRDREDIIREGWVLLLEECLNLGGKCTRIDIPTDDYSGHITADEIKRKIQNKEFTTRMRRLEIINSNNEEDVDVEIIDGQEKLVGMNSVIDSKLSGYSATFGNTKHLQLCIYDKHAEQTKRGFPCKSKSWIRYEVRYFHKNAEQEIPLLLEALKNGSEGRHIVSCLAGLFEFKEPHNFDSRNRYKAKVWKKWVEFIGDVGKKGAFSNVPTKTTIQTTIEWLTSACSIALAKVIIAVGAPMSESLGALLLSGFKRMNKVHLQEVNQQRRILGLVQFESVEEMVKSLLYSDEFPDSFSQDVTNLFLIKKDKK